MSEQDSFSYSIYEEETHLEERELLVFVSAVTGLFGPEKGRIATEAWLEEAELIDAPPRSIGRDWRSVSIAALARIGDGNRYSAQSGLHGEGQCEVCG